MKTLTKAGSRIRNLTTGMVRRALAVAAAAAMIGIPFVAAPAQASGAGWYDGMIQYSAITNCVSIIQGSPYVEYGAGTYVGFYANPDAGLPATNTTYYLHIVIYGLGNSCAGQYAAPELVLPADTSLAITAQPLWLAANTVSVRWNATAGTFLLDSCDVLCRRAAWNADFGSLVTWRSATTATSGTFAVTPGYTYCFSARARDTKGGISPMTAETCTAIPLDDRSLARSAGWTAGTGAAYYRATYLNSTKVGAKLLRKGVVAKRIAIVATTGPGRGRVGVYWGSTLLKTINLESAATVNKKLILVTTFPASRSLRAPSPSWA